MSDDQADPKYLSVMALPEGIEVIHTPARVTAMEGGPGAFRYTWLYKTTLRSTVGDLALVEFGAFVDKDGRWAVNKPGDKPFTPEQFTEWYSCPGAKLPNSETFTDPENYSSWDTLHQSPALWYYVGEDDSGKRYRGVARIDKLPRLGSGNASPE